MQPHDCGAHGVTRVLRLKDCSIAGFLEDLTHEPVDPRKAQLDDYRSVPPLLHNSACLACPARSLRRDPHACSRGRRHLAGAQPAVDLASRINLGAWLELLARNCYP